MHFYRSMRSSFEVLNAAGVGGLRELSETFLAVSADHTPVLASTTMTLWHAGLESGRNDRTAAVKLQLEALEACPRESDLSSDLL